MTQSTTAVPAADTATVRPFEFEFSDSDLTDLRQRIAATRWPEKETVEDDTQGVQLDAIQALAKYWSTEYDWRKCEAKIKALPNFITEIDGLDIHFIHVRSKHENALPLIVCHGWPGSVVEQMKIVGPLTDPTAYGGSEADAFDVVVPSMPGYGFSAKPTDTGWSVPRIARAWNILMRRLGYNKYVAQGGDWGALVVDMMGVEAAPELVGIHTNMAAVVPPDVNAAAFTGQPAPADLSAEEKQSYEQLSFFYTTDLAYAQEMGTHPQTLYGISDSPIGLASWILDHDIRSYRMIKRSFEGVAEGLSRDDVLDNITLFWLTNTGISSARLYWENKLPFLTPKNVTIPVGVSAFPDDLCPAPRSWAEKAYPNLIFYKKQDKGGHFAAWEQPEALVADVREAFRSLR